MPVGVEPEATDDEYEYQYDENETETFLVDLDLTSLNGPLTATESKTAEAGKGENHAGKVEIVELASGNPLVRYGGQMYSCEWVDMIGTSMFFTRPSAGDNAGKAIINGSALPGFSSTNWRTNIARRKQADFLARLMQTKRRRGETDIVPTQKVKLSNLSDRVVKGDARAVAALREMYASLPGAVLPNANADADVDADAATGGG
ncbi:hypothetical protein DV735_g5125, partial [Chaetothyriales sp. CBS 134920]